jgi:hypothetical protein
MDITLTVAVMLLKNWAPSHQLLGPFHCTVMLFALIQSRFPFPQRVNGLRCDDHRRLIGLQLTGINAKPELLCECTAVRAVERKLINGR